MSERIHVIADAHADDALAAAVRAALARARAELGVPDETEVTVVLADDATLRELNRRYRGIDRTTDVLAFASEPSDVPPGEAPYLGDVLISAEHAARNAIEHGLPLVDEVRLLATHGLLHLLGHDDATDEGADAMCAIEVALGVRRPDDT